MTAEQFTYQNYDRPARTHTEVFERMEAYAKEQLSQKESQVDSGTTYTKQEIIDLLPTDDEIFDQFLEIRERPEEVAQWMRDEIVRRINQQAK